MPTPRGTLAQQLGALLPNHYVLANLTADGQILAAASGFAFLIHTITLGNSGTAGGINLRNGTSTGATSMGRVGCPANATNVLEFEVPLLVNALYGDLQDASMNVNVCVVATKLSLDSTEYSEAMSRIGALGPMGPAILTAIAASAVEVTARTDGKDYWVTAMEVHGSSGAAASWVFRNGGSGGDPFAAVDTDGNFTGAFINFPVPIPLSAVYCTRSAGAGSGFMNLWGWVA